LKPDQIIPKM